MRVVLVPKDINIKEDTRCAWYLPFSQAGLHFTLSTLLSAQNRDSVTTSLGSLPSGMGSASREPWQRLEGRRRVRLGYWFPWLCRCMTVSGYLCPSNEGGPFYVSLCQVLLALGAVAFPVVSQYPAFILIKYSLLSLSGDSQFGCGTDSYWDPDWSTPQHYQISEDRQVKNMCTILWR